jgi:pimeloyl-ACP methyl ester carboxylesterase
MPIATIDGVDLYFELHGAAGEPLVLVHGYTGDVTDWRHQLPEFAKTHRVLAFDHRGHGRSAAPAREAYTIERMADDVEALAAEAGFDRYHLLGHSMGGAVVQEVALRSPGRLLSLTLEDTSYHFGFARNEMIARWVAERHRMAEEEGMAAVANVPSPIAPPPHMPESRREEERERLSRMPVDGFIGAWNALGAWSGTTERAGGIAARTLVICGDLDAPLLEPSKKLASMIPDATLEIIPEAAHSPQFERPNLFNAALRRHLERTAGAPAK